MKNKQNVILAILIFFYTLIGLFHSNNQGFWHDEIYTLTFLKGISAYTFDGNTLSAFTEEFPIYFCKNLLNNDSFLDNFHFLILHEGHPPLYFLFLKIWATVFGYSELALRSFSLSCGLISINVLFCLIKEYYKSKFTIWIITLLVLFNPFLFYYFTEARMYAFAFLLAIVCFKYWLRYKEHRVFKSFDFFYFTLSCVALLYSHYYGLFFFLSLVIYDAIKNGISARILNYTLPIVLFSPWIFIIKLQTDFHKIHWTDGSFSFLNSLIGFGKGIISLFFSPMSDAKSYEMLFSMIIGMLLLHFIVKSIKNKIIYLVILIIYFSQIYLFDLSLNHHTIIVPRYYIFILIFFYWFFAKAIDCFYKPIIVFFSTVYLFSGVIAFYQMYNHTLAPKQMYKELASYIDSKYDSKNTIVVVEPGGPIIWGLSNYLKNDFSIISAEYLINVDTTKTMIYVDEMLGDKYWENHLNTETQKKLKLVPFVGVYLYE